MSIAMVGQPPFSSAFASSAKPSARSLRQGVAGEGFQVRKSPLQSAQNSAPEVIEASTWARELVRLEALGPGDLPNAMARIERRHGLPARTLWSLRYRPPKDVFASIYNKLRSAYEFECERQLERLKHEITITKLKAGADAPAVCAAAALVGENDGAVN